MTTYSCPKGHASADPDFCSECGAKIAGAPQAASGAGNGGAGKASACPDCGLPKAGHDAIFCEVCGYNYSTGAHGEIAISSEPQPVEPSVAAPKVWSLVVAVQAPSPEVPRDGGSPPPPSDFEPITIPLLSPVNLIGRHSAVRAIDPEIPLDFDDAVSHRHAILTRSEDGTLSLRDIGSSNGTELNGTTVTPMTDCALKDGDELALGHWTRLTVKSA